MTPGRTFSWMASEQLPPDEWRTLWRMMGLVDAGKALSNCTSADSYSFPLTSDALLRSEPLCLFALAFRKLAEVTDGLIVGICLLLCLFPHPL
ncbi:hypothetical protein ColTof4_14008 [Colletotrichum tofieldiae]|nr:hypothetical protein ColTof3_14641 [Colletotrichum tofieldiae]GKT81585.1 hypothetical protein ColTof4_14008 [Colletotrichum tofieldiae]GKT97562.1 hypothetical protein Ct61P_15412 [Colletotrichum tofieldiae]